MLYLCIADNGETIKLEKMKSLSLFQETLKSGAIKKFSPQNGGISQLNFKWEDSFINELEEIETVSSSRTIYGLEFCLDAINKGLLNYSKIKAFKVLEAEYDIHPKTKEKLSQRGRATKWEWVEISTKEQFDQIIENNKNFLI